MFLIFGDVLRRDYVVVSWEVDLSLSQCVVNRGPYQYPNSCTP